MAFTGGSIIAAFAQGVPLRAILQGVTVVDRAYAGGWWDWLSPFSLLKAVSLVAGYGFVGATWLIMKTEGELQARMREQAAWLGALIMACIAAVSAATPFLEHHYYERWSHGRTCCSPRRFRCW